jgi:prepilin-type N-terminal cleavage/methylation domain-containing protein/prepilin-type processing-associated H-X9-DG protein
MRRRIQNGFTIVELLVVIAIIAAVMAILLPGLGNARAMARRVSCGSNLHQIDLAMRLYLSENKDTYPCVQDPIDPNVPRIWLWMGRGWRSFISPYFGEKIDVNNPSVLRCPGDQTQASTYEATSYAYSMAFYHSPQQINNMVCTANHDEQWNIAFRIPSTPQESDSVVKPARKIIVGDWNSNHQRPNQGEDKGWWNNMGCRNFLLVDGHVQLLQASKIREAVDGNPNPNLTKNGIEGIDCNE